MISCLLAVICAFAASTRIAFISRVPLVEWVAIRANCPTGFEKPRLVAALSDAIHNIRLLGANEKMIGPNAGRVIALVANNHAVANITNTYSPGNAMCEFGPAKEKLAVSFAVQSPDPLPTPIRLSDLAPKPRLNIHKEIIA